MKKAKDFILGLLVLLIIAGMILGFLYLLFKIIFEGLDKNVQSAIITAVVTIGATVFAVIYNQRKTKEREIAEEHRSHKVEIYKEFMIMIVDILRHNKVKTKTTGNPADNLPEGVEDQMYKFTRNIIVWGSPDVIKAYTQFRNLGENDVPNILIILDTLLKEIRADLGNSNKGLQTGDLIKLFITDPENLDALLTAEIK